MAYLAPEQIRSMSVEDFDIWQRAQRRWLLIIDTSEALLMAVVLLWGFQLCVVSRMPEGVEPISKSLLAFLPAIPLGIHGGVLLAIGMEHMFSIALEQTTWRRRCIFCELTFFLYVWFALVLSHVLVPGLFIVPAYIVGCIVNYLSLFRLK